MKKTILFVILEQYADWEAAYLSSAIAMLGQDNYEIKTVSLTTNPVHSIGGFQVIPDYDIESAPADYEALMLALHVATDEKIMEWYNFHKLGFYNAPMPKM